MTGNLAELLLTVPEKLTAQEQLKWIIENADRDAPAEIIKDLKVIIETK